jgi:hypothetical protein
MKGFGYGIATGFSCLLFLLNCWKAAPQYSMLQEDNGGKKLNQEEEISMSTEVCCC